MSLPPTRVPDDADDAADAPVDLIFAGVTSDFTPGTRTVRVRALDVSQSFSDVRSVSVGGIHFVRAFVPGSGQDGPYCDYVDVRDCVQGHYSFRGERLVFETTILVDAGECAGEAPLDVPGTDGAPGTDDMKPFWPPFFQCDDDAFSQPVSPFLSPFLSLKSIFL